MLYIFFFQDETYSFVRIAQTLLICLQNYVEIYKIRTLNRNDKSVALQGHVPIMLYLTYISKIIEGRTAHFAVQ